MTLMLNSLWVIVVILFVGCDGQKSETTSVQPPDRVSLNFPEISFRWLENSAEQNTIEATIRGTGETVFVSPEVIIDGDAIEYAMGSMTDDHSPAVIIKFTEEGAQKIFEATNFSTNRRIALVVEGYVIEAFKVNTPLRKYCALRGRDLQQSEELAEQLMALIGRPSELSELQFDEIQTPTDSSQPTAANEPLADAVIDRAIIAVGGSDAVERMISGTAVFKVDIKVPGAPPEVSDVTITVYYDAPDMDRREIRTDPAMPARSICIKNGDRYWEENEHGIGKLISAFPMGSVEPSHDPMQHLPFNIGVISDVLSLKDSPFTLKVEDDEDGKTVVGAYLDTVLRTRILFDKDSHLPVQREHFAYSFKKDSFVEPLLTTIRVAEYRKFGEVLVPTRVVAEQDGTEVMRMLLLSADFESHLDAELFQIPE